MKFQLVTSMLVSGVAELDVEEGKPPVILLRQVQFDHHTGMNTMGESPDGEERDPRHVLASQVAILEVLVRDMKRKLEQEGYKVEHLHVNAEKVIVN